MHVVLLFFIFMHLDLASHLGALDESCEGLGVGTNTKTVVGWTHPEGGRTKQVL